MIPLSPVLAPYAEGFREKGEPFLVYVRLQRERGVQAREWTRGQFWELGRRAATVLRAHGLRKGDRFLCGFGENRFEDLAFRLASAMTGAVPVTVNWQADTADQVSYKLEATGCRLVLHDSSFPGDVRKALLERFPSLPRYDVERLEGEDLLPEPDFCADLGEGDDRIVIFTSGSTGYP